LLETIKKLILNDSQSRLVDENSQYTLWTLLAWLVTFEFCLLN
jgi:hypothetical protein